MSPKPENVSHMAEQMDMKKRKEIMKNMYRQGIEQTSGLVLKLSVICSSCFKSGLLRLFQV